MKETLKGFTKAELTENIDWNLDTGVGVWIKARRGCKLGAEVGAYHSQGYRHIKIKGKNLRVHRIIYFLTHGHCPKYIDHINQIKDDNRIDNLRGCTQQENLRNRRIAKNNKSGYKGVCWNKQRNKWRAQIRINGKSIHLGYFGCPKEASEAYETRAKIEFGEFYKEEKS